MSEKILFLAGLMVVLGVGVLIGSGLHTTSIDRQYRRLAQRVRHLNEREAALNRRRRPAGSAGPRGVGADVQGAGGCVTASAVCSCLGHSEGRSTCAHRDHPGPTHHHPAPPTRSMRCSCRRTGQ